MHLERITYRFFEEQQAMLSAYETKEVDVAVSLPSVVMELYQGKDDLAVTDNIATRYIYPNLDVKPLDDVRVREAINLAINREDLCKMVGEDTEPTVNFVAKRMKNNTTGEYFVEEADPPFEEKCGKGKRAALSGGVSGWERISCFDLQISVSGIRCRYGPGDPGAAQAESEYRDQAGGAGITDQLCDQKSREL